MRIVITDKADAQVQATAEHIEEEFGRKAERKFKAKFRQAIRLLKDNPYLGPVEPLLAGRTSTYRSVVVGSLNKMVYYIEDEKTIYVVAFWDCRQEPAALASQVK